MDSGSAQTQPCESEPTYKLMRRYGPEQVKQESGVSVEARELRAHAHEEKAHVRPHSEMTAQAREKAATAAEYYSNVMMTFARACPVSA